MKKLMITGAMFALMTMVANAQEKRSAEQKPNDSKPAQTVEQRNDGAAPAQANPNGTTGAPRLDQARPQPASPAKTEEPKKGKERVAISEKGVPASKAAPKESKEKAVEPRREQPVQQPKH